MLDVFVPYYILLPFAWLHWHVCLLYFRYLFFCRSVCRSSWHIYWFRPLIPKVERGRNSKHIFIGTLAIAKVKVETLKAFVFFFLSGFVLGYLKHLETSCPVVGHQLSACQALDCFPSGSTVAASRLVTSELEAAYQTLFGEYGHIISFGWFLLGPISIKWFSCPCGKSNMPMEYNRIWLHIIESHHFWYSVGNASPKILHGRAVPVNYKSYVVCVCLCTFSSGRSCFLHV